MKRPSFPRRVALVATLAVTGVLGAAFSVAASSTSNPPVSIKIDEKPVSSANSPLGPSYAPIVKRVAPSVVKVLVTERAKNMPAGMQFGDNPALRDFFDQFGIQPGTPGRRGQRQPQQPAQEGLGSGVIVSADGYILTNNHVVNGADTIKVALNDGREFTAKVIGTDPKTDLAVIKVDAKSLPSITFADSEKVEVGDRVLAVGNPFGIGQTVTSGMVSGLGRASMGLDYEDFIQTDAAINPGNSGGALVDAEGRLVGINTAILSRSGGSQGIGFAIPSGLAHSVMEQLVANGRVVRGFIGVGVQDVTEDLAKEFKLESRKGALVAEIIPDAPADKAGLQVGDLLTKIDGKPVSDMRHVKLAVAVIQPGKKVGVEAVRKGKTMNFEITVANQPNDRSIARNGDNRGSAYKEDEGTLNGVGVADLDVQARREFDVPETVRGVLVTSVDPDSASAAAGLQPGDVILEINSKKVKTSEEAVKLTEKSTDSMKTLLRVWNQRGTRFMIVDESSNASPNS